MNLKQYRAARKVLSKDCEMDCVYLENGKTCAIGALSLAAGVERARLITAGGNCIGRTALADISSAITRKFGLTRAQQIQIQSENDNHHKTPTDRRVSVLARLEEFKP